MKGLCYLWYLLICVLLNSFVNSFAIILSALGPWHPRCLTHYCMSGSLDRGLPDSLPASTRMAVYVKAYVQGQNHLPLSTTGINPPCQSNLSDKTFTEKGAVSLTPKKDNTRQLYRLHFYSKHSHYFQNTGKRFVRVIHTCSTEYFLSSPPAVGAFPSAVD